MSARRSQQRCHQVKAKTATQAQPVIGFAFWFYALVLFFAGAFYFWGYYFWANWGRVLTGN